MKEIKKTKGIKKIGYTVLMWLMCFTLILLILYTRYLNMLQEKQKEVIETVKSEVTKQVIERVAEQAENGLEIANKNEQIDSLQYELDSIKLKYNNR